MKQALFAIILLCLLVSLSTCNFPQERVYNCGMAEWHPDIPKEVKEECRRRALEYWKDQQKQKTI
jgi:hypothetical protein